MKNLFCVATIFIIHAFLHLTNAGSYSQSYGGNTGQGYSDESGSYVTNFGNGKNKHNVVHMNESPDGLSLSGTSYSKDRGGNPSVQKINVDFNEPNYNGGSQGPNVRYNPRGRTQITNIGNGQGNKNMFVFNDNRQDQDGNTGHRRGSGSSHGYQDNTRSITNIGKGPDNDNRFYVDGKRVYPNAVNTNGDQDSSVTRESLPSSSDDQIRQNQGGFTNNNFKKPNGGTRNYGTRNQGPSYNEYSNNYYPAHSYNQVTISNSNFPDVFNDPLLKELPMPNAAGVAGMKAIEPFNSVISEVSRYANDFGNGSQNSNRIIINGKEVNPNAFNNNLNISNKRQGHKTGENRANNNNPTEDELLKVPPLYHSKQNKG